MSRTLPLILVCLALQLPALSQDFSRIASFDQLGPNAGRTAEATAEINGDADGRTVRIVNQTIVGRPDTSPRGGAWFTALAGLPPGDYQIGVRYLDRSLRYTANDILIKRSDAAGNADEDSVQTIGLSGFITGWQEATVQLSIDAAHPNVQLAGWGVDLTVSIDAVWATPQVPSLIQAFDAVGSFAELTPNAGSWNGAGAIDSDLLVGYPDSPEVAVLRLTGGDPANGPSTATFGGAWGTALGGLPPGAYRVLVRYRDYSQRGFDNQLLIKRSDAGGGADEATAQAIALPGMVTGYQERERDLVLEGPWCSVQVAGWGQALNVAVDRIELIPIPDADG